VRALGVAVDEEGEEADLKGGRSARIRTAAGQPVYDAVRRPDAGLRALRDLIRRRDQADGWRDAQAPVATLHHVPDEPWVEDRAAARRAPREDRR
jgi:hypothetical protein